MPGGIKISKPERLPKDSVSETDLYAWWNELMNYLGQHDSFKLYKEKGIYSTWQPAEVDEDRITTLHASDKGTIEERQRDLNNFITIIAGCCARDQYMMVIKQATSLKWIWEELTLIYQHQHKGKEFLSIADLEYNPSENTPLSFYNSYRAKLLENMKPVGTIVKWKNNTILKTAETISPTFEDHILLTSLLIIDKRLPAKIKEIYGPRMEEGVFLMDLKMDILSNVTKILEDLDGDTNNINAAKVDENFQAAYMGQANRRARGRGRYSNNRQQPRYQQQQQQQRNKFCRLCHLTRQERNVILSHEIGDLNCPSLSQRDLEGIKAKYSVNSAVPVDEEEDLVEKMAQLHGYDNEVNIDFAFKKDEIANTNKEHSPQTLHDNNIHVIQPVPSQIITVYQQDIPIHIDLDSGCWISTVRLDFAKKMKWNIHPNGQLAKIADGKTVLKAKGEIHEVFKRNNWNVKFSAIVMEQLHTEVIGGNNFLKDNNIRQDITARTITINNKYVVPETNRNTELPVNPINTIITIPKATVMLPNQTINLQIPQVENKTVFVEPMPGKKNAIQPQICEIKNGMIEITNDNSEPAKVSKEKIIIKEIKKVEPKLGEPGYKIMSAPENKVNYLEDVTVNDDKMTNEQKIRLNHILSTNEEVFDQDLRKGYNHKSGPHYCKLKFANDERPSSRKVSCVQYNNQMNVLLQQVCDQLTEANVLGVPQHEDVQVQHVMPIFLRKKQKAKDKPNNELTTQDVRLVVNTCELSKYMKSLPAKISRPQEVYNALAKWKFIIKTDLHQGFFQNHLHKDAQKWCGILTPFGGLRFFKRGIQGLINQSEELDELLANIFNDMLTKGKLVKLADDLFTGGNTVDEALANFDELLTTCKLNNIKLSPGKTFFLPSSVDVMSWIWSEGGTLSPSPHRKQALQAVQMEDLQTVKDIRSWVGLYKTFLYHTPNLTKIMDPFDKLTGDKDSKDIIIWTTELKQAFQIAKDHISNIREVYLPHPEDQLIITTDGARNPPGIGFVLQARDQQNNTRTVRYYSVKLKPHHIKWSPCEIESVAFGTAIEAFYEIIKEAKKPVIICPDSKPVCDATKLLQKGKFSLSPRIQTFLNNIGKINCEVQHVSGKSGQNHVADFQSRNTPTCNAEICQLCNYVSDQSDTIIDTKISAAKVDIPYANRDAWRNVQTADKAINLAKTAISTGQLISKKGGKINSDARKIVSCAKIANDGLLVVHRAIPFSTDKEERIIIPSSYLTTLVNQIHNQNNHPSKHQMKQLFDKYFFGVGVANIIDDKINSCPTCCSIKRLPNNNIFTTTTNAKHPGTHFGCDVLKRAKQKIMVVRDQFSSYTVADFIKDETAESMEECIIRLVTPIRHTGKVVIRTDQATGFVKVKTSKNLDNLNINIELGNSLNKNSNAVVDKGIQELEKEITILQPGENPINTATLAQACMNLNDRLRRAGTISARHILFSRDDKKMTNIQLDDELLAKNQLEAREKANHLKNKGNPLFNTNEKNIEIGDHVMLNVNPKKHCVRDTFEVIAEIDNGIDNYQLKKVFNPSSKTNKLKNKVYTTSKHQIFKVNEPCKSTNYEKNETSKYKPFDPIKRQDESSTDDDSDEETVIINDALEEDMNAIVANNIQGNNDSEDQEEDDFGDNISETISENTDSAANDEIEYVSAEEDNNDQIPKDAEKTKPRHVQEAWILPIKTRKYLKLETLKKNLAAIKIQTWYRKQSQRKRKYNLRSRKTPEKLRNCKSSSDEHFLSDPEYERYISDKSTEKGLNNSKDSLEWDTNQECTELSDEHNDAFYAASLNLDFPRNGTDLMAVYDFTNVLPLTSEMKEKSVDRKPFKYFNKLLKKRGGTPSKRQH